MAGENTLTLGRSGTGKTTLSTFKILSLQVLFIVYAKMQTKKSKEFKLVYSDLDNYNGLGIVFVTASPVLTNEVWRYYNELLDKIWLHFKNKYEKKLAAELSEEE